MDKERTIKRLLEESTEEMVEVWTRLMAVERGSMDRVKKCLGHKSTRELWDQSNFRNVFPTHPSHPGQS